MVAENRISTADEFLASHSSLRLEDHERDFENYMSLVRLFRDPHPGMRMLEIGIGTGWFPLLSERKGYRCEGLELTPEFIDHARRWGASIGLSPLIRHGNIETAELGESVYDVVFAQSVFEHVRRWRPALANVFRALKPGGLLVFSSTNKFCPRSGEYEMAFYGWLPNALRYRFRVSRQGPRIMELGIDYNQFTYPGLRRAFRRAGFSRIYDRIAFNSMKPGLSPSKRKLLGAIGSNPVTRALALTFCDATMFVCVK